jgi:glyoxylase-like metal-dependent hydrolase (beta-lactamase superfamily II)
MPTCKREPAVTTENALLTWDVFVSPVQLIVEDDLPPGEQQRYWPPISATLISGERDALLVDPLMTIAQAQVLAGWVAASGKHLTAVYVTHGHGDHFLGLGPILERFPDARAVAAPAVVEQMTQQAASGILSSYYEKRLPRQVPDAGIVIPDRLDGDSFELEGHELVVVDAGHTDTDGTTCLHVPELGLIVAGDVAYNDVHLHLGEGDEHARPAWIKALDTIEALEPKVVIAGHKRPERPDNPTIIEETRQYIRDFDRTANATASAEHLYAQMLSCYPDRLNRGALWSAAQAAKPTPVSSPPSV